MHVNCLQCSWSSSVRFFAIVFCLIVWYANVDVCLGVRKAATKCRNETIPQSAWRNGVRESDCSSVILILVGIEYTRAHSHICENTLSQMVTFLFYLNVCHFSHCALFCVLFLRLFARLYIRRFIRLFLPLSFTLLLLLFICIIHRQNTEQFVM